MSINQYINDEQDPKMVEKIIGKIQDMLISGELISYIAVQKKPAVTLLADCIVLTNKRIFICEPTKLGLSTNFEIFDWSQIKTISFKEEFFGSKFTIVPSEGENITVGYIPKVQARKLYQCSKEAMEKHLQDSKLHESRPFSNQDMVNLEYHPQERSLLPEEEPVMKEPEDELTKKLQKLKALFDKQLITQQEYEQKKDELLSQL